ncbi:helix-turn-helix domain-containing protein [Flavobacteriaceae bacterium 14752]|uniref:helix-turn-helix domain-containing protein n=1 Tax=Mesohalobacter salilacus TaxID=2491711 RepID=UPI000F62E36E|nr:AraC family transcriptional regulator [Flavobacteriaceae bacterium 14752]
MKLYIKNMSSLVDKSKVSRKLKKQKIAFGLIDQKIIELPNDLNNIKRSTLKKSLIPIGMHLQSEKKCVLIEKIKATIQEMIRYSDGLPVMNNSIYISTKLHHDYTYLANIFSEVCGITIQQYIILSKVERAKEMFLTENVSLTEISYLLHYSSVAHLSAQFKKTTGHSPSCYKLITH